MEISIEQLKQIMKIGNAVSTDAERPNLEFIEIKTNGLQLTALATDWYISAQTELTLEKEDFNTYYIKPFKVEKAFARIIKISKYKTGQTIVDCGSVKYTFDTINEFIDISKLYSSNFVAKRRISKSLLNKLLKCCDTYVDFYFTDDYKSPIKIETDNAKGLICPIRVVNWDK